MVPSALISLVVVGQCHSKVSRCTSSGQGSLFWRLNWKWASRTEMLIIICNKSSHKNRRSNLSSQCISWTVGFSDTAVLELLNDQRKIKKTNMTWMNLWEGGKVSALSLLTSRALMPRLAGHGLLFLLFHILNFVVKLCWWLTMRTDPYTTSRGHGWCKIKVICPRSFVTSVEHTDWALCPTYVVWTVCGPFGNFLWDRCVWSVSSFVTSP